MHLMIISDVHGKLSSLKKALEIYKKGHFKGLLILGDILYHGPRNLIPNEYNPSEAASLLNQYKDEITAVRGNCDSEVDQMLLKFPIMSDYALFQTEDNRIILTHGHLPASRLPSLKKNDILASGHTHIPRAEKSQNCFLFNPGSISLPKGGNPPSFGILDGDHLLVKNLDTLETINDIDLNRG